MTSLLNNLHKLIVVGDKILIRPTEINQKTDSGLYLPPGVKEKEKIQSGYIIKVGPGWPIPTVVEEESWKEQREPVKYIPLQAKEGDLALFLKKDAFELEFEKEKLLIVPQNAILLIIREDLF
ncbi:MAG: co-chaperone GroES [Ignavibacteriales bacterium]|nr:co-chaperone GroES [Ignavibacteriales bacterium]HOJ19030.1 co-chaperone GroES family protein [Ignavibacteriaceae bacterium]